MVESERLQPLQLLIARGCRDHGRARALGELDRCHSDAAGSGVNQNSLALGEVPSSEQALVRGPERDRHARRAGGIEAVGDRPGHDRGGHSPGGVRSGEVQGDDPVADCASLHAGGDDRHGPGAQIADDVRRPGELPAGASQHVSSLDADRLGIDHHASVRALGLGDLLVAEYLRSAVLMDDRRFHCALLSRSGEVEAIDCANGAGGVRRAGDGSAAATAAIRARSGAFAVAQPATIVFPARWPSIHTVG